MKPYITSEGKKERLASMVAVGRMIKDAAKEVGITERSAYRLRSNL
jgi:hypothetical protein